MWNNTLTHHRLQTRLRSWDRRALPAIALLALWGPLNFACGGEEPEDDVSDQAFRTGYSRLQSADTSLLNQCVVSVGTSGMAVNAVPCSNLTEEQGFQLDPSKHLRGQTTGPAKCLAVNPGGRVISAVCADGVASQTWAKVPIVGTALAQYTSGGKCLTLAPTGALTVQVCQAGSLRQRWRSVTDPTLDELLSNGVLNSPDVPTGPADVVIPATPGTLAVTDRAITHWELTYIKYQPTNIPYETLGVVAVGRDEYEGARFYFRSLHIYDPATLNQQVHHSWKVMLVEARSPRILEVDIVNKVATRPVVNSIANVTAYNTAIALLLRDIAASQTPRAIKPTSDVVKAVATTDGAALLIVEIGSILLAPVCWQCTVVANAIPLLRKAFPANPAGGTEGCGSDVLTVAGGAGQCVLQNRPAMCPLDPNERPLTKCAVQTTHPGETTSTHSRVSCSVKLPTGPGLSCTKSPVPPGRVLCDIDCTQTHTECAWAWCTRKT